MFHTLVTDVVVTQEESRHTAVHVLEGTAQVFHTFVTELVAIQVQIGYWLLEVEKLLLHLLSLGLIDVL